MSMSNFASDLDLEDARHEAQKNWNCLLFATVNIAGYMSVVPISKELRGVWMTA